MERGEEPSDEKLAEARAELIWLLMNENWEADYSPEELAAVDTEQLPKVFASQVVYISESLARFVDDHGLGESYAEECWVEEDWVDIPRWLLKGRKHRWALRWDCCNIGSPENYKRALVSVGAVLVPQPEDGQ